MLRRSIHLLYWFGPFLWDVFHVFFIWLQNVSTNDRGCYKASLSWRKLQKESLKFANDFFFFFCFGKSLLLGETLSLRYGQVWVQPLHFSEILVGLVLLPFETMNKIKVLPSKLGLSVHCLVRSLVDHRYWHQFKKD